MASVSPPEGVNRLMAEAERTARGMFRDGVERGRSGLMLHVPDAGAVAMIRRNVEDAAHLHDDLLTEVLNALESAYGCQADLATCTLEELEAGTACSVCQVTYRLRCAGVG